MVKSLLRVTIKVVGFFLIYLTVAKIIRKRFHFPAPAFIGHFLDSDIRRALQPPGPIIQRSGIQRGMQVLELGCGSGAYTTTIARAVGNRGRVCALDIQPAMLEQLQAKLDKPENQDIRNVELFENSAYELPFDDETFDAIYTITVLQEIPEPGRALTEAKRVLKPKGRLAVTEWLPDPDYPLMVSTVKLGQCAGFEVDAALGNWTYTVRFRKSEAQKKEQNDERH